MANPIDQYRYAATAKAAAQKALSEGKSENEARDLFKQTYDQSMKTDSMPSSDNYLQPGGYDQSAADWYNPFSYGKREKSWVVDPEAYKYPSGVPAQFQQMGINAQNDWNAQAAYLAQLRAGQAYAAQQAQAAGGLGNVADVMWQHANGQNLYSQAEAQRQLALGQGAIASRAATAMRGAYDPATNRAAMYATGQLGGDVAGQAMMAAAQERMAAAQAVAQARQGQADIYGQMRGVDIEQMYRMTQMAQNARQYGQQVLAGYQAMGMQDKDAELQTRIALEAARANAWMGKEVSGAIGPALGAGLGAIGVGAFTGWNPTTMAVGAQGFGALGGAASNW